MLNLNEREKQVLNLRKQGYSYDAIGKMLDMTKSLVAYYSKKQINQAKIECKHKKQDKNLEYEQNVCKAVPLAKSMNDLCRLMNKKPTNNNYLSLQKIIDKYNLDISHFSSIALPKPLTNKKKTLTFEEKFSLRGTIQSSNRLKSDLLKLGLKEHKCEKCGNTHWNNESIPLQLHHINGNRYDNRIENLQMLCPNCHAQTDTYAGRNINNKTKKKYVCQCCGKEFHRGEGSSKSSIIYCSAECRDKMNGQRNQYIKSSFTEEKMPRISKDELIQEFKELKSFVKVGKKIGVTDNAVRKWCKKYNLPVHTKEMITYINNNLLI